MNKPSEESEGVDPLEPKPPVWLQTLKWLVLHAFKYKLPVGNHSVPIWPLLLVVGCFCLLLLLDGRLDFRSWVRREMVVVRVIKLDQEKCEVSLRLDNRTGRPVVIEDAYLTIWHRGLVPIFRVLSDSDRRGAPSDAIVFRVPQMGGVETIGDLTRLNVNLMHCPLVVGTNGPLITNLVASIAGFRTAVDCFHDGSPLDIGIQFIVLGDSETSHDVHLSLGTYSQKPGSASLERGSLTWTTTLLPSPSRQWSECKETFMKMTGTNWVEMFPRVTTTDGGDKWRRIKTDSNSLIVAVGGTWQPDTYRK